MKTETEVNAFRSEASKQVYACDKCEGDLNGDCECVLRYHFEVSCFEACVPRDFWYIVPGDVEYNTRPFNKYVRPYCKRIPKAHRRGYGLLFTGPNGVGKSMFMSYILSRVIRSGRTAYYTTMLRLDHDMKRGFRDPEATDRLEWMLSSDFLAIDEMGKDQFKAESYTFMRTQVERILKQRFDESRPVLMASNMGASGLSKVYGDTIGSIVRGKYQTVSMEPGDVRKTLAARMMDDMGYEG